MKIQKHLFIVIMIIILLAVVAGCSASNGAQIPTSTTGGNTVLMQDFKFQPAEITIKKGETITWINKDSAKHDVTSKTFVSGLLSIDQSFLQTFNEVGTFDYNCTQHPNMTGQVIVTK